MRKILLIDDDEKLAAPLTQYFARFDLILSNETNPLSAIDRIRRESFAIRRDDRFRHLAIVGKTGMGKSTLLERLIVSDIRAGRGVALIDPQDRPNGPRSDER